MARAGNSAGPRRRNSFVSIDALGCGVEVLLARCFIASKTTATSMRATPVVISLSIAAANNKARSSLRMSAALNSSIIRRAPACA
eukprot:675555-Pyramimonas_sp.AAC.1